jgi:hypothetical protein
MILFHFHSEGNTGYRTHKVRLAMPLTPITPKAPSREGTSTTLSYEFNHKTLSTLELPWHGHPYGNLLNYPCLPVCNTFLPPE